MVNGANGFMGTEVPGAFTIFGGKIVSVGAPQVVSGTYASDSLTNITVTFTASSPTAVLAWAAHISSRIDWGPTSSAISIPGSPYHTGLVALDGSGGSQDRALATSAIVFPASIQVQKIGPSVSAGPTSFGFTASPAPLPPTFTLPADGSSTSTSANTTNFGDITSFTTYTITENPIPAGSGWRFVSVLCNIGPGGLGATTTSVSGATATINLAEGDPVTCTYTKQINTHTVTLNKTLLPSGDAGRFNLTVNSTTVQTWATAGRQSSRVSRCFRR